MGTIKSEIKTSGKGLMKNRECEVLIKPSRGGNIRIFSKGADVPFNVCIENLYSTDHCVTLCSKEHRTLLGDYKYKVMLCEHFIAACAICGIDSIDVYLSETEMPIFDGSSKVWVELFKKAGIEGVNKDAYTVSEPVYYLNGNNPKSKDRVNHEFIAFRRTEDHGTGNRESTAVFRRGENRHRRLSEGEREPEVAA